MYRVVRAKLNVGNSDHISGNSQLATVSSLVCSQCGYGHIGELGGAQPLVNRCENCDALLTETDWVRELYRIETIETLPVRAPFRSTTKIDNAKALSCRQPTAFCLVIDERLQRQKADVLEGEDAWQSSPTRQQRESGASTVDGVAVKKRNNWVSTSTRSRAPGANKTRPTQVTTTAMTTHSWTRCRTSASCRLWKTIATC